MASVSKRRRVSLVDGYIREQEEILKLSQIVPKSINIIIFEFQLLLEKWNKKWSNSKINIIDDGSIAEMGANRYQTVYGDHIVKYGESFVWNLEITTGEKCNLFIGIIPNHEQILTQYKASYN